MNAYITLDYELFLGERTGDVMSCLIRPMEELCKLAKEHGIILNVFADAAYLIRLNQLSSKWPQLHKDYEIVTDNLRMLDQQGHFIQLHLHPQWLYSNYDGEEWEMDRDHYKLSDLPFEEQQSLIIEGVNLLNALIQKPVSAYRAGGYSIKNFAQLSEVFKKMGIRYDTSVLRGEKASTKYHEFDYSNIPLMSSYSFSTTPTERNEGDFVELPISTKVVSSLKYLIEKRRTDKRICNDSSMKQWGNGVGIGYPGSSIEKLMIKLTKLIGKKAIRATIDGNGGSNLEKVYQYCLQKYSGDCFVIIGHPKLTTPFSLKCLGEFVENHPEISFTGIG